MLQHETGHVVVRFGLDEDGDETFSFELSGTTTFEAWAGLQLVASFLESRLQAAFIGNEDDDEGS